MRHRAEAEGVDDAADAEPVERGVVLGDARRAYRGSAPRRGPCVRPAGRRGGTMRWPRLGKDAVAHLGAVAGHLSRRAGCRCAPPRRRSPRRRRCATPSSPRGWRPPRPRRSRPRASSRDRARRGGAVVSSDCTFIIHGLPSRASSTSEASVDEPRITGGMRLRVGTRPQHRHLQLPEPALVLELAARPGLDA